MYTQYTYIIHVYVCPRDFFYLRDFSVCASISRTGVPSYEIDFWLHSGYLYI